MDSFIEGDVVICITSQAGTIADLTGSDAWVILRNGDVWVGPIHQIRLPQDQADLDACPIDVEKLEEKRILREKD